LEATKTTLESANQANIASLTRDDILGDMFYAGGLGYYAQLLSLSYISGLKAKGYYQLAAGYGTVGYEPVVDTFFGTPRSIKTGGVAFDIPMINVTADQTGDAEKKRQFTLQVGTLSSALEHITPEQMFASTNQNAPKPDAISAVKALQKASAAGQKIYQINQANMNQVLPLLHHDRETLNEIKRALNVGKDVTTHTDAVSIPGGWSGFGYIITDPVTGDGAYKISGGANGGKIGLDEKTLAGISGLSLGFGGAVLLGAALTAPISWIAFFLFAISIALSITLNLLVWSDDADICFGVGFAVGASLTRIGLSKSLTTAADRIFWTIVGSILGNRFGKGANCL